MERIPDLPLVTSHQAPTPRRPGQGLSAGWSPAGGLATTNDTWRPIAPAFVAKGDLERVPISPRPSRVVVDPRQWLITWLHQQSARGRRWCPSSRRSIEPAAERDRQNTGRPSDPPAVDRTRGRPTRTDWRWRAREGCNGAARKDLDVRVRQVSGFQIEGAGKRGRLARAANLGSLRWPQGSGMPDSRLRRCDTPYGAVLAQLGRADVPAAPAARGTSATSSMTSPTVLPLRPMRYHVSISPLPLTVTVPRGVQTNSSVRSS